MKRNCLVSQRTPQLIPSIYSSHCALPLCPGIKCDALTPTPGVGRGEGRAKMCQVWELEMDAHINFL